MKLHGEFFHQRHVCKTLCEMEVKCIWQIGLCCTPFSHSYHVFSLSYHVFSLSYHVFSHSYHVFSHSYHVFSHSYHVFSPSYHVFSHSYHVFSHSYHVFSHSYHVFSHSYHVFHVPELHLNHSAKAFCEKCVGRQVEINRRTIGTSQAVSYSHQLRIQIGVLVVNSDSF